MLKPIKHCPSGTSTFRFILECVKKCRSLLILLGVWIIVTTFAEKMATSSNRFIRRINDKDILIGGEGQEIGLVYHCAGNDRYSFVSFDNTVTEANLKIIDTALPKVISAIVPWIYEQTTSISALDLIAKLEEDNPLHIEEPYKNLYYKSAISRWLGYAATCPSINVPWPSDMEWQNFVELQHGSSYAQHSAFKATLPYVLTPYCYFEQLTPRVYSEQGKTYTLFKIQVRYVDRTAPTRLGAELGQVLSLIDGHSAEAFEKLTAICIRLCDRYEEQVSFFGQDTMTRINGQVY